MKATKKQIEKFKEAACEAGCSENEAEFDRNLKRIAKAKTQARACPG